MASAKTTDSQARLKAEGFPAAPLVEAVMAIRFSQGLSEDEVSRLASALMAHYATSIVTVHREVQVDPVAETVELQDARQFFRLEAEDTTEIALVRPDQFITSQLAPYRSWEVLFQRFARDLGVVWETVGDREVNRIAVRYINRIDVPVINNVAQHEKYLAVHIHVPDSVKTIGLFHLQFEMDIPEVRGLATIQSAVMPPAVEGMISFALDIDVAKTTDIPSDREELLNSFQSLRDVKNGLYRQFLTPEALEQFK